MLYIGTDGKLRGMAPVAATPAILGGEVHLCWTAENGQSANGTLIVALPCDRSRQQSSSATPTTRSASSASASTPCTADRP